MAYKLVILDVDGTLADQTTHQLLPGVREWFKANAGNGSKFAIASNQGGVALRAWMQRDGWGDPRQYPTEADARDHLQRVVEQIDVPLRVYVCFAYQTKAGKWAPVPDGKANDPEWRSDHRKPAPGMLQRAMYEAQIAPQDTLFVGDSKDDQLAAIQAGCAFRWADDFFGRATPHEDL